MNCRAQIGRLNTAFAGTYLTPAACVTAGNNWVAGWRAWRPLIPRTWRQMPNALAADYRIRGNLDLNMVDRRSSGVAASSASSNGSVPAIP